MTLLPSWLDWGQSERKIKSFSPPRSQRTAAEDAENFAFPFTNGDGRLASSRSGLRPGHVRATGQLWQRTTELADVLGRLLGKALQRSGSDQHCQRENNRRQMG